jgi:hypothetical protein
MASDLKTMITDWKGRIDQRQRAHLHFAGRFDKYHYAVGLPAVICATIAGATLFTEVSDIRIRMAVGAIGLIAGVLSAVQTFYSHAKRGEQHRTAAAQLGRVRREIEIFERFTPQDKKEQEEKIRAINEAMGKIEEEAPVVSSRSGERWMGTFLPLGLRKSERR